MAVFGFLSASLTRRRGKRETVSLLVLDIALVDVEETLRMNSNAYIYVPLDIFDTAAAEIGFSLK